MDLLSKDNLALKLFVEFLGEQAGQAETAADRWSKLENRFGYGLYRDILFLLTQKEFEPTEARRHWREIIKHREKLCLTLRREVGLQVAVCDYFMHIDPMLKDLVLVEVHRLLQKERSALIDELTGLYNRRFFNQVLPREVEGARRANQPFSLIMADLDNFKGYNDALGHPAGDLALSETARLLARTARTCDYVFRYGGEEFVLILPRTDAGQALYAAERCRHAIEEFDFSGQNRLAGGNLTISMGVATFPDDAADGPELLQRADVALYRGKKAGRNRVVPWAQEKRDHPRFPVSFDLFYRFQADSGQIDHRGVARDISLGGLLCYSSTALDVGRDLEVTLNLPGGGPSLVIPARVARLMCDQTQTGTYYLGLSFQLNSPGDEEVLRNLVRGAMPH